MRLSQRIFNWTYFGTSHAIQESEKRHIIFSNVIFITLPVVYLAFILLDLKAFLEPTNFFRFDRIVVPSVILLCIGFLLLNKVGFTSVSRILFLLSWILLLHVFPIIIHQSPIDYYFAFPSGIIFHSVMIHVSFSSRKEPWKFWPFLIANFVLMMLSREILVANDVAPEAQNSLRNDPYFVLDIILYWLLFNLLTFYLLYVVEDYIVGLNKANKVIANQRKEMAKKNSDLSEANLALQKINHQVEYLNRNLEDKVHERTKELEIKNEKLVKYAHLNAHHLRGPFCRVKGLVMLKDTIPKHSPEMELINYYLKQSIDELDEVTRHIQLEVEITEMKLRTD